MNANPSHPRITGYLGTYASLDSRGIYCFTVNTHTGQLTQPELYYSAQDCKYLSLADHLLASPIQGPQGAGICFVDTSAGEGRLLAQQYLEKKTACFVTQDDNYVYTANYHQGQVLIYRKSPLFPLYKKIAIREGAGCHQVLLHNHSLLVPCLLLDKILIYDCSRDFSLEGSIQFPEGTGPRHGIFTKDHKKLLLASELSNEVFLFEAEGEKDFRLLDVKPVPMPLKQGGAQDCPLPPAGAAIRLSMDERFVYASTRFTDVLTVFALEKDRLTLVQQRSCGGSHPRDILLTPDGRFLLAANRTQGGLVSFPIDQKSGKIGSPVSRVPAPEAVSIVFESEIV